MFGGVPGCSMEFVGLYEVLEFGVVLFIKPRMMRSQHLTTRLSNLY
jgi:hypothetical protein